MRWTIGRKIMASFLVVIALVAIMSALTYFEVGQLNLSNQQAMQKNLHSIELAQELAINFSNEAVAMRRFNFTGEQSDIKDFNAYREQADKNVELLAMEIRNEQFHNLIASFKREKAAYESIAEKSFEAKKIGNLELVGVYMKEAGQPYKQGLAVTKELVAVVKEIVDQDEANSNSKAVHMQMTLLVVNVAILVIAILISLYISRNLARRMAKLRGELMAVSELDLSTQDQHDTVKDEIGDMAEGIIHMKKALRDFVEQIRKDTDILSTSSHTLTSTVEEQLRTSEVIANTAGDIAAGSTQNTENITDISRAIEEVTAGTQEMSASAADVNHMTTGAVSDAQKGMQLIHRVVSQNETIQHSMKEITDMSTSLVKGSSEIQEIISAISSIASQTNLLALNAAIEAARAGEAGRGFAVVAEEVRKLAEQSENAASHIEEIIKKMTADIHASVSVVDTANQEVMNGKTAVNETAQDFKVIVDKLGHVQAGMEQITHAVEEAAKGMQSIVDNIQNISAVAEETSASTQTVAAAAEEQNASLHEVTASAATLSKMAAELNAAIGKFKM